MLGLTDGGRRSVKDARAAADRGQACVLLPGLHDALSGGEVSAGHADVIARTAKQLDDTAKAELQQLEAAIVESATTSSVEVFDRQMRDLERLLSRDDGVERHERLRRQRSVKRWVDRQTGMCHTRVVLDPVADAKLSAALDAAVATERAKPEIEGRTFEQLTADAFVELVTGARGERRVPEISVLIDVDTLRDGLHDHAVCETADGQAVPPATVRRLACDAELLPVVLDGAGVALDVGRSKRMATPVQRAALRAMYATCAHPGCTVRFADCAIHHVTAWAHGGRTDMDQLLPLCDRHHHAVHDGGWQLRLFPDRTIELRHPDGSLAYEGSTVNVAPSGIADVIDIVALARARARALDPPSRAPAA